MLRFFLVFVINIFSAEANQSDFHLRAEFSHFCSTLFSILYFSQASKGSNDKMFISLTSHVGQAHDRGLDLDLLQRQALSLSEQRELDVSSHSDGRRLGSKADGPQAPSASKRKRGGNADVPVSPGHQTIGTEYEEAGVQRMDKLTSLVQLCRAMPLACLSSENLRRLFDVAVACFAAALQWSRMLRPQPDVHKSNGTSSSHQPASLHGMPIALGDHLGLASDLAILLISRSSHAFQPQQAQPHKKQGKERTGTTTKQSSPSPIRILMHWTSSVGHSLPLAAHGLHLYPLSSHTSSDSLLERLTDQRSLLEKDHHVSLGHILAPTEAVAGLLRALASAALSPPRPSASSPVASGAPPTTEESEIHAVVRLANDLTAQAESRIAHLTKLYGTVDPTPVPDKVEENCFGLFRSLCQLSLLTCELAASVTSKERRQQGGGVDDLLRDALEGMEKAAKKLAAQVGVIKKP